MARTPSEPEEEEVQFELPETKEEFVERWGEAPVDLMWEIYKYVLSLHSRMRELDATTQQELRRLLRDLFPDKMALRNVEKALSSVANLEKPKQEEARKEER